MIHSLLRCFWLISTGLLIGSGCRHDDPTASDTCRLSAVTDQLIETSGKLTDETSWSFTYGTAGLSTITTRTASQTTTFGVELNNNQSARLTNGQDIITFTYGTTSLPVSATFSRGGATQATYTLEYGGGGVLNRLTENRLVLAANSLVRQRDFSFTYDGQGAYDGTGNLVTERDVFTLRDGLVLAQEEVFTHEQRLSPYTQFAYRPMLTVLALALTIESVPGRFWDQRAITSMMSYNLTSNGTRADLRENSTYKLTFDADSKLISRDQTALLYQSSVPTPITKKNRQTFEYLCE